MTQTRWVSGSTEWTEPELEKLDVSSLLSSLTTDQQPDNWQPWPEFAPYWQPGDRLFDAVTGAIGIVAGWVSDHSPLAGHTPLDIVIRCDDGSTITADPLSCYPAQ